MKAILSITTKDEIKSRVLSPHLSMLVFDVYITPSEFAKIVEEYDSKEFDLLLTNDKKKNRV